MNISKINTKTTAMTKSAMTFSIRFWAVALITLLIFQFGSQAHAGQCKFEKIINETLDLSKSEHLTIFAVAGDLDVIGVAGTGQAVINGRVCASKESWMEESVIVVTPGNEAEIMAKLPSTDGGWLSGLNSYAWMDLKIEVPYDLALEVNDSSGDLFLKNIAAVQVKDSSGDIEIENARGSISISDSSGDIEIDNADGDLTIESDSSGDIDATEIYGTVLVMKDSSGDIEVSNVSGNFIVERDSSGDISAEDIDGDFRVLKDGSGGIHSRGVQGEVDIPEKD